MRTRLFVAALLSVLSLSAVAFALAYSTGAIFRPPVVTQNDRQPSRQTIQLPADLDRPPPERNLYDLARRLSPSHRTITLPTKKHPTYHVGDRQSFWVVDLDTLVPFTVTATLEYITPHAYFYVADGVQVAPGDLRSSADEFERRIYPTEHRYLGTEWVPGIDNDEHLTVLNARIPAVGGYYSAVDEYPTAINPYSNEREMIYMNVSSVQPGTGSYNAILAHEFAHAIHWNMHRDEQSWVAEGLAEATVTIVGYRSSLGNSYAADPDTQLDSWPMGTQGTASHYGAASLFMLYLAQHYGGYAALHDIITEPDPGIFGIDDYLASHGYADRFDDVFRNWLVANYLDDPAVDRYHYQGVQVKAQTERTVDRYEEWSESVHQYGADYVDLRLPRGSARVTFSGDTTVPLAQVTPHSGNTMWWSDRGDGIDTTLTREMDLTRVSSATLTFWAWYDIERNWDYVYVEASTDGGATWTILPGTHTSPENPVGLSFGPGYTGTSGGEKPAWQHEQVDLSRYAGRRVLVRFEYVTDEGTNGPSFFLDDIAVPEIGFYDDVEGASQWQANGFVRTNGVLPQHYILELLRFGSRTVVEPIYPDANGTASFTLDGFGDSLKDAVLVVAGDTPVTTEVAHYRVSVTPTQ